MTMMPASTAAASVLGCCVQVGASKVYVEDLRQDFLHNYIFPSIQANGE